MQNARSTDFFSLPVVETIEQRLLLDSQIGTVTMPFDGYLSAAVYDSSGQIVATLRDASLTRLAAAPQQAGQVALMWDGRDEFGRTVFQDGTYTWKALVSQVSALDQGGVGDSQFTTVPGPNGNLPEAIEYGISVAVNGQGGTTNLVGGTLTRAQNDSFYGDTSIASSTLDGIITASGKFDIPSISSGWQSNGRGGFFIGHFSENAVTKEYIGLEFQNTGWDNNNGILVSASMRNPGAGGNVTSSWITLPTGAEHTFSYTYDPSQGQFGRLTVTIDSLAPMTLDLGSSNRTSGAVFDAFGMGYTPTLSGETNPAKTVAAYIDDVSYTGRSGVQSFDSDPGWTGLNNASGGNDYGWRAIDLTDNSVYQVAAWLEEGSGFKKIAQDGTVIWEKHSGPYGGVAADNKYVYASVWLISTHEVRINRYSARDGSLIPFTQAQGGAIIANPGPYDPAPGKDEYNTEQYRLHYSTLGMASDGVRLFVSNYRSDKFQVYDANGGQLLAEFDLPDPLGIAVESTGPNGGSFWVAHSGNRVSRYTYRIDAQGNFRFSEDVSRRITGLSDPGGVAIGGTNGHLFVSETTTATVREFDVASVPTPAGLQSLGSLHQSGPISDSQFRFDTWGSIAVDSTGILNVYDYWSRVQRFHTEGVQAGELYQSWYGQWFASPTSTYNYTSNGMHYLMDGNAVYEVDPEYTGGPRTGWLGDGSWRLAERYYLEGGASLHRTIMDGQTQREFIYRVQTNGPKAAGVVVFAMEPDGPRMAAIVGIRWTGVDRVSDAQEGQYTWTDTDGDGQIDWNGYGEEGHEADEVTWYQPLGQLSDTRQGGLWVDNDGNIWATGAGGTIVRFDLLGFDAQGNPLYDWAVRETVVTPEPNDDIGFYPGIVRVGANGDIYAAGNSVNFIAGDPDYRYLNYDFIAHYNSDGQRTMLAPIPPTSPNFVGFAADETSANPQYFFTGTGRDFNHVMQMFTNDGLLVTTIMPGEASGYCAGWIDHRFAVTAFTHPINGELYVYGEDVSFGKSIGYRIDNLDTVTRLEDSFAWTYERDAKGIWQFDGDLTDSVGVNDGTFSGGTPVYGTGASGQAIDLDGIDDGITLPYADVSDGYTISAWVKPTDTSSVNIINRTNSSGGVLSQIRINSLGRFEAYLSIGTNHTVTGTTIVQSGSWYHVALVAEHDGMLRLYVNGQPEGDPVYIGRASRQWAHEVEVSLENSAIGIGDRFAVGNAVGSFGFFDGMIDDVQVREAPISAAELQAIYTQVTAVTVQATDKNAAEAGSDPGTFTISRNTTAGNLTVHYTLGGTATSGSDYTAMPGWAVIPDGQSSVDVTITPIDDTAFDASETVILTVSANANYAVSAPANATVTITDDESVGDWGWTGSNNAASGNSYGWSYNTNYAGGSAGEVGGTFARAVIDSYYGDTNLTNMFNLDNVISASGKFAIPSISDGWTTSGSSGLFIGHFSQATGNLEFIGLEFGENSDTTMAVRARIQRPGGGGDDSDWIIVPVGTTHSFAYTYDPDLGDAGRLTFTLDSLPPLVVDIGGSTHASGAQFDAFGIGYTNNLNSENAPTKTAQVYMDDVNYSGQVSPLATVTVAAGDTDVAEQGVNTGTFIVTRSGTAGDLTVMYSMGGSATGGADYSALSGSVLIPDGQALAVVTLTPIDDSVAEGDETAILSLTFDPAYVIGTLNSAVLTIVDSEPTVTVTATDAVASEQGPDTGTFTIVRNQTAGDLTVNFAMTGTADNGSDYSTLPSWVLIPDGQASAVVTVTPIDDILSEVGETVILTIASSSAYTIGSPSGAAVTIADNDATGAPGWTGSNNTANGNNFGWSPLTSEAGGTAGEIGGTLARSATDTYFGDIDLNATLSLNTVISASGKFDILDISAGWTDSGAGRFFVGHFSEDPATSRREFIGMEIENYDETRVIARGRFQTPGGSGTDTEEMFPTSILLSVNGNHTFSYTYNPSLGPSGRLTITIDSTTVYTDLSSTHRSSGASFDAFGMGYTSNRNTLPAADKTVRAYIDDLSYSGLAFAYDGLESGNTSGGTGWGGSWTLSAGASVTSASQPRSGSYHMVLTGSGTTASRAVNLAGVTAANLLFDWKANSLEAGESVVVEIYNGSAWQTVLTISDGQDDNLYHSADINLSGYNLTGSFQVRFRSLMNAADDYFYVDNVRVTR